MNDRLFKIGILVLGLVFAALFYVGSQNLRFTYHKEGNEHVVLDTRTGRLYAIGPSVWLVADPLTGSVRTIQRSVSKP
jgi:hypothetical protein